MLHNKNQMKLKLRTMKLTGRQNMMLQWDKNIYWDIYLNIINIIYNRASSIDVR